MTAGLDLTALAPVAAEQRYQLLLATVSGAHLYGFPSVDSDVDMRGVHLLPAEEVVRLRPGPDTLERTWIRDGVEIDLVTHDVVKFVRLMLRPNGYVLEQLLSPLVVATSPAHAELVKLAPGCVTRHHADHYRGFATGQWSLFERTGELKPLLYTLRVLLTGIHLMRSAEVVAHLPTLLDLVRSPQRPALAYVADLVARKVEGEHTSLRDDPPMARIEGDVTALHATLDDAQAASALPAGPSAEPDLDELVVRLRLARPSA